MDQSGKQLRKRIRRLAVAVLILCGLVYLFYTGGRMWKNRELTPGVNYLNIKDYDHAVEEFRAQLKTNKYRAKARGLLLFSLAMKNKPRRPMLALLGVDADGLLRLSAFNRLLKNKHVDHNQPQIQDLEKKVIAAQEKIRERMLGIGIATRNWNDAETVLWEFSEAVWSNLETSGQTRENTAIMLDFAAVYMSLRGMPRSSRTRVLNYIMDRMEDQDRPMNTICLIPNKSFMTMLETEATNSRSPIWQNAVSLLEKNRLYGRIEQVYKKHDPVAGLPELTEDSGYEIPEFKNQAEIKKQFSGKTNLEELAGFAFDPLSVFWKDDFLDRQPGREAVAWVYGLDSRRKQMFYYFYMFTEVLQWEPLRFSVDDKLEEQPAVDGLITDFKLCAKRNELSLKIYRKNNGNGNAEKYWLAFPLNFENKILEAPQPPRNAACKPDN